MWGIKKFGSESRAVAAEFAWPAEAILSQLRGRYGKVEHLGTERDAAIYGVEEAGVRFAIVLIRIAGRADMVGEIGFVARFQGYSLTDAAAESLNRNLHISFFAFDGPDDAYLVGGVTPAGEFREGVFGLLLDAWRRDLAVTLYALTGDEAAATSFPGASLEAVRSFTLNSPKAGGADRSGSTAARFLGARAGAIATCKSCDGRGRIGMVARSCDACGGFGLAFNAGEGEEGARRR
ncbi:MAG: hypothetical protein GC152_11720 [Alphaproteobacteria bacterium]|nr:hypothetical protein [Alphaproteobacteria bacterium]